MAILERLLRTERAGFSAAAARSLLKIDFETADRERMHQLAVKAQDGTLTAAEQAEIDAYEVVGHMLGLMHSKARKQRAPCSKWIIRNLRTANATVRERLH
jgi:Ser/Thr protein kinase RdoA (MazF antagonist)